MINLTKEELQEIADVNFGGDIEAMLRQLEIKLKCAMSTKSKELLKIDVATLKDLVQDKCEHKFAYSGFTKMSYPQQSELRCLICDKSYLVKPEEVQEFELFKCDDFKKPHNLAKKRNYCFTCGKI